MRKRRFSISKTIFGGFLLISFALLAARASLAQAPARPDRGIMPGGSYAISDFENVNMTNGNVNLSIPLAALPPIAGGKLSPMLRAIYNSKVWNIHTTERAAIPPLQGYTVRDVGLSDLGGWRLGVLYTLQVHRWEEDHTAILPSDPNNPDTTLLRQYIWKIVLTTPDGASHELRPVDNSLYPSYPGLKGFAKGYYKDTPDTIGPMRYYSFDGSFIYAVVLPGQFPLKWDVYLPDGTRIKNRPGIQQVIDTNGNSISITTTMVGTVSTTHITDDRTGREISISTDTPSDGSPASRQVKYKVVDGADVTVYVNYGRTHVQGQLYRTGDPCLTEHLLDFEVDDITSIVLPNTEPGVTRQFTFHYNSDAANTVTGESQSTQCADGHPAYSQVSHGLGELSEVDTPDGARIAYKYRCDLDGLFAGRFPDPNEIVRNSITKKTVEHDGTSDTWSYDIGFASGSVTGPDGSVVTEEFYSHDPGVSSYVGSDRAGLVYRTTRSGKEIIERQWSKLIFSGADLSAPGGGLANFNPVVTAEYTTLTDSAGHPSKMSARTMQHDYNGNLISETDFDWIDLTQVTVPRDTQLVPTSFPGTTELRTVTNSFYNPASTASSINYAKRNLTDVTPLIVNAPRDSTTGTSQTRFSYEGQLWDNPPTTTGNLTMESRFKSGTTWIDTTYTYDPYGNKTSVTDPNSNRTDFTFDPATHAQPTEIKVYPDRLNETIYHQTTAVYDYWTGAVTSHKDPNDKVTTIDYRNQSLTLNPASPVNDPFLRPGLVIDPAGRKVTTFYHDNLRQVETKADLKIADDALLKTMTTHDKLGRVTKVESSENGSSYSISSQTLYKNDSISKVSITKVSNPTRGDGALTDGWTRTTRDDYGRVLEVATFSGSATPPDTGCSTSNNCTGKVITSYDSEYATVTDQASKQRRGRVDALGRLVRIDEPTAAGLGTLDSPNQKTEYSYDSRGNLTLVTQGTQTRTFVYDNLSRLTKAKNPETLQVATIYDYDNASNLTLRTNPNAGTVGFDYDGLNRAKKKTLTVGVASTIWNYNYDTGTNGKGRLASVVLNSSTEGYYYDSYDAAGRVTASRQITSVSGVPQTYSMSYEYDVSGNMTKQTYPSGKAFITEYDDAGRIAGVRKDGATLYYAGATATDATNRIQYGAPGGVSAMKLGNGRWEHTVFNSRLQPTEIGVGTGSADSSLLKLEYAYNTTGQTNNNGNVRTQLISAGGVGISQTYTYDELNRLSSATETGAWTQNYDYDRWGNRVVDYSSTYIPSPALTPQGSSTDFSVINQSTNRINTLILTSYAYDASGNVTSDPNTPSGGTGITYDAENRQTSYAKAGGGTTSYSYDGDGRRVKKTDSGTAVFVYNVLGQLVAEYTSGTPEVGGGTTYLTEDHLGSVRLTMHGSGDVKSRHDYLPFGEEIPAGKGNRSAYTGYVPDNLRQKFTQKERDSESGLDYFLARYYSSAQGRFTSPDEFTGGPDDLFDFAGAASANPTFYADLHNPQSLNKYQYAYNNPLRYRDPNGHDPGDDDERKGTVRQVVDTAADVAVGALRGFASSVTFGIIGAPKETDSVASRLGQAGGSALAIVAGTGMAGGGAVGGILTSPTIVGAVAGGAVVAGGVAIVSGGLVNGAKIITTPIHQKNKGEPGGPKDRSTTEAQQQQLEGVERAQKDYRSAKSDKRVDSTKRSKQEFKKGLKKIENLKDAEEQYKP